jgi:hypothetical protein
MYPTRPQQINKVEGMAVQLTKRQKKILGKGYLADVFHASYGHLHAVANADSYYEDEEEQTFDEFVEMGNRPPNAEGTGRFTLTNDRKRIGCIFFIDPKEEKKHKTLRRQREHIRDHIQVFFGLETDIIELKRNLLDIGNGTIHIGDYIYELTIVNESSGAKNKKRKKSIKPEDQMIEVFSLFDAFESLTVEPYLTTVAFVDNILCEVGDDFDNGYQLVCGRACGNRIACVSLRQCTTMKDVLCVAVHELLHTIGFDHCNSWQCLMNASGEDSWLFLSPVNLRKLKVFHGIPDDDQTFLVARYEQLLLSLKTLNVEHDNLFQSEVTWLEHKLHYLTNLVTV